MSRLAPAGTGEDLASPRRAAGWAPNPVSRVVVPVEGGDDEYLAQEQAVRHAAALGVPVMAIHIDPTLDSDDERLWGYLTEQCERQAVTLHTMVLGGQEAGEALADEVDAMDLVVIGTRRIGTRYHMHSVAEHLIRHSPATIQVVRLHD